MDIKALRRRVLASARRVPEYRDEVLVFGEGPVPCDLMVIGEAPGREETRLGRPFVGRAGRFLREVLGDVFRDRGDMYISNVVKFWPRVRTGRGRTRRPTIGEFQFFLPYVEMEIEAVSPRVIVAVGRTAFQALCPGRDFAPGRWEQGPGGTRVMPVYHPAYILRNRREHDALSRGLKSALRKVKRALEHA